jgi:hypothetical protein
MDHDVKAKSVKTGCDGRGMRPEHHDHLRCASGNRCFGHASKQRNTADIQQLLGDSHAPGLAGREQNDANDLTHE